EVFVPVAQAFRNVHAFFKGRIPQVAEYGEVCRTHAQQRFAWLDEVLADRPFVAGERYTIADITALCGIDFGRVSDIPILPEQVNLARCHAAVSARPSAKARVLRALRRCAALLLVAGAVARAAGAESGPDLPGFTATLDALVADERAQGGWTF